MGQISTVEYLGDLRTKAIHLESGSEIFTDAPKDNEDSLSAFHILPVLLPDNIDRNSVIVSLKERGIQSSIHYPAFCDFSAYKDSFNKEKTPVALNIIPHQLTLPLFPSMTFSEVDEVTSSVLAATE